MNTLRQKIAAVSEKPGLRTRAKTVVSLDASNIAGWAKTVSGQLKRVSFPGESDIPAPSNDVDIVRGQVVSMAKLAEDLGCNDDVSSIKYYTPEPKLSRTVIEVLYSWLVNKGLATRALTNKELGSNGFVKELDRIYRNLVGNGNIEEMFERHAPMVRALFRLSQNKAMISPFRPLSKVEVVTRPVENTLRSIAENPDHRTEAKTIDAFLKKADVLGMEAANLDFYLQIHDFANLDQMTQDASATVDRMRQQHPEIDWEDLPATMQKIRSKLGRIIDLVDELNQRADQLRGKLASQSEFIRGAAAAVTGPSGYMKGDMDTALAVESMSPEVLRNYDQQVVFSGDGDFIPLYRKLIAAGKRVIVVAPERNLSQAIRSMNGDLIIHDPRADDIWMDR